MHRASYSRRGERARGHEIGIELHAVARPCSGALLLSPFRRSIGRAVTRHRSLFLSAPGTFRKKEAWPEITLGNLLKGRLRRLPFLVQEGARKEIGWGQIQGAKELLRCIEASRSKKPEDP
ncbi:MAG: hypothetical protein NVSMB3_03900 [Acidobacteriaceae bacterium]